MRGRNSEAARLEVDYLERVRAALAGRDASEVEEVLGSVRDHIEEELSEDGKGGEVSLVDMANVLEHLGPPAEYRATEEYEPTPAESVAPARMSRKAVAAALSYPALLMVDALILLVGEAAGILGRRMEPVLVMITAAGLLVAAVLCVSALIDIRQSGGRLRGKWLAFVGLLVPVIIMFAAFVSYAWKSPSRTVDCVPVVVPSERQSDER